jgi:hypothetical protein
MSLSPRTRVKIPTWKLVHKELVDETKDTRRRLSQPPPLTLSCEIERNKVTYQHRNDRAVDDANFLEWTQEWFVGDYKKHDENEPSSPLLRRITSLIDDTERLVASTEPLVEAIEELRDTDGYDMEDGFYLKRMNFAMLVHNHYKEKLPDFGLVQKDLENRPLIKELTEKLRQLREQQRNCVEKQNAAQATLDAGRDYSKSKRGRKLDHTAKLSYQRRITLSRVSYYALEEEAEKTEKEIAVLRRPRLMLLGRQLTDDEPDEDYTDDEDSDEEENENEIRSIPQEIEALRDFAYEAPITPDSLAHWNTFFDELQDAYNRAFLDTDDDLSGLRDIIAQYWIALRLVR